MKDVTCWTCPFYLYSGDLDVGECTAKEEGTKSDLSCDLHPNSGDSEEYCSACGAYLDPEEDCGCVNG